MRFAKGDRVRFLNDVGEGEVVGMVDARTYMVRNAEGFDIPTPEEELLPAVQMGRAMETEAMRLKRSASGGETGRATASRDTPPAKPLVQIPLRVRARGDVGLHVGFQPKEELDPVVGPFRVHVINASEYSCFVTLARMEGDKASTFFAGKVEANAAREVKEVGVQELEEYRRLFIQALYYSATPCELPLPEAVELAVTPARFVRPGSFQENPYLPCSLLLISVRDTQREALLHSLVAQRVEQAKGQKEAPAQPVVPKPSARREEVVIDLHMHALTDRDDAGLSAQEMLAYQLQRFEQAMEEALAQQEVRRLVAIHGVGNGRLRGEVVRILQRKYPMCSYQDASFKEYGYGATMVLLRRKH